MKKQALRAIYAILQIIRVQFFRAFRCFDSQRSKVKGQKLFRAFRCYYKELRSSPRFARRSNRAALRLSKTSHKSVQNLSNLMLLFVGFV